VGSGHCVTEGPFSDLRAKYYDNIFENPNDELLPRCLSRGFADGATFSGDLFSPEVMKELFSKTTFDDFLFYLERTPHNGIPLGIRGDFLTYTAPYGKHFVYFFLQWNIDLELTVLEILYSICTTHKLIVFGGFGSKEIRTESTRIQVAETAQKVVPTQLQA
jgi:hypothetical protein